MYCPKCDMEVKAIQTFANVEGGKQYYIRCQECYELISSRFEKQN